MSRKTDDHYAPWRTSIDAMRLSYQHFVWREHLGYNLHPSVKFPGSGPIHIADIATGHGLWVLQVSETLDPHDTYFEASDISLDLCPREGVLPSNIKLRQWDFFSPIPDEWLGKFDLVHVRLIVAAFREGKDPKAVLEKLGSMLKPGGYLQWDEYEYCLEKPVISYSAPPSVRDPSTTHPFATQFYHVLVNGFGWPIPFFDELDKHFSELGLVGIVVEKQQQRSGSVARAFYEYYVTFCAQMVEVFQQIDPKRAERLEDLLRRFVEAAKTDGVLCGPIPKVVVGWKPL